MDRGTKATLTRTIPRSLFKSYTKDLSFLIFELVVQHRRVSIWLLTSCRYNVMILNMPESMPIVIHENITESRHIAASPAWILA